MRVCQLKVRVSFSKTFLVEYHNMPSEIRALTAADVCGISVVDRLCERARLCEASELIGATVIGAAWRHLCAT